MPVLLSLALAGGWLLSPPADPCPAFPSDPAQLVPDQADAVLGVDVDGFASTDVGKAVLPALRADLQIGEALTVLDDCGLELARTYAVTAARGPGDARMVAVQGRNFGSDGALSCLTDELRARSDGASPWTRTILACIDRLELRDGSRAWIANDYSVVWARGSFIDEVEARLLGDRPLALPATLRDEFARLDRSGQLWLAARLDASARQALPGTWARDSDSLTAAIDLNAGLRALVSLTAPDVSTAAALREQVVADLLDLSRRLDDYGVSHKLRERARVGIREHTVAAELVFTASELRAIRERVGEGVIGRGPL